MRKKGFTLIELLAVIVILAVIALIAVPVVLKIIENSKKGAAKTSALNYMKAVETYLVASKLDRNSVKLKKGETYNCTENTIIDEVNYLPVNELVQIKGYRPTGSKDKITIDEGYRIDSGSLTVNGYTVSIKDKEIASVVKGPHIKVESISLNYNEQTMEKGSTFELKPIFTPKDASDQRLSYKSSDESIVTVSEKGIVTAKKNGNAKITVTSKEDNDKKAECNVTVITSATGVSIEPSSKEIEVGKTVQLTGTIEPGDVTTNALTWTSSDVSIAHVDENGLVTGMSVGTATITARTVNGKTATSEVTVKEKEAESVRLNKTSASLIQDETVQLSATISPNDVTNKTLTWTSSNTSVATVSNSGLVTAKSGGTATITVKTSNNKTATASISVESCSYATNAKFNFAYNGTNQTFLPQCPGKYKLEVWGAQGGAGDNGGSGKGLGGYSYGTINVSKRENYYIYVGGKGTDNSNTSCNSAAGGFNGGARSGQENGESVGGGGGATDIRIGGASLYRRVIVAGGGGGDNQDGGNAAYSAGGGGLNWTTQTCSGYTPSTSYKAGISKTNYPDKSSVVNPTFGSGGYETVCNDEATGGGGGGFYGGAAAGCNQDGQGGSGWIYTADSYNTWKSNSPTDANKYELNSAYYLTNYGGTNGNRSGNGYATITYLGK